MVGCRFYEHRFPEIEDVVMVNVVSIREMGAYVDLLEYKDIEGMILLSELSRRRIRSINKLIRVGRTECVVVIRVDKTKGYIDLSKRRVSPEEIAKCEEKYANAKAVNSILRHVGRLLEYTEDSQLEELHQKTAWHFDRKYNKPGASFDVFKSAVATPSVLDECELDEHELQTLLGVIRRRMTPQSVKIRADLEVACYTYEGVDAVKAALRGGLEFTEPEMPVKINLIAPPLYVVTTQTLERADGLAKLEAVCARIKELIEAAGGKFDMKRAPKVVSDVDDAELASQLAALESANKEVEGDEDGDSFSEDEDTSGDEGDEPSASRENGGGGDDE